MTMLAFAAVTMQANDGVYYVNGHPVYANSFGNNGGELPRLSLVSVFEVLHLLLCYNICWIFRDAHNCLENSCNVTEFLADYEIYYVNNQ